MKEDRRGTRKGVTFGMVQLLLIGALTVGKIIICSVAGFVASKYFPILHQNIKGLSAISVTIFLPCLLFSNLVLRITWEELEVFYWAPLLAFLPAALGYGCSLFLKPLLHSEWHGILLLGCVFQNGITLSLSVILTLKDIPWLTAEAVERAQSYIFLYNIPCSLGLWAIGEPMIASYKREMVQKEAETQHWRKKQVEVSSNVNKSMKGDICTAFPSSCELEALHDVDGEKVTPPSGKPAETNSREDVILSADSQEENKLFKKVNPEENLQLYQPLAEGSKMSVAHSDSSASSSSSGWALLQKIITILWNPPIFSSLAAIIISLVPPLRWVAESHPCEALIGGIKICGDGTIPLQLLILGCTVNNTRDPSSDTSASVNTAIGDKREKVEREEDDKMGTNGNGIDVDASDIYEKGNRIICLSIPQSLFFSFSIIVVRLLVIPAVCFVVIHFLRVGDIIPSEREFLLSILLGTCAPSAINSSLICAMHGYRVHSYAQMIFMMYIATVVTTSVWLTLYIWYLGY